MQSDLLCKFIETAVVPAPVWDEKEADHRIANSLQLVAALLGFQASQSVEPAVRDALVAAINRIAAVGWVHRQLCRPESRNAVNIASYLIDLSANLEQSYGARRRQVLAHAQNHFVTAEFACLIGIVVTELVMDACKHAYAPAEAGSVKICLFFPTPSEFQMEVRDYGGPSNMDGPPPRAGDGPRIINAMSRKLNAVYAYVPDDEGTRFYMRGIVPLDAA